MKILLDTCAFLWLVSEPEKLSRSALEAFTNRSNEVYLSAVSAWEIGFKHRLGKLPLPGEPARFIPRQRIAHRIEPLPLDEGAALALGKLPDLHKDPFDRMLICQAISSAMTLLTPDPLVTQYPVATHW